MTEQLPNPLAELRAVLVRRAEHAPDPDPLLVTVRRLVDRRRRRRRSAILGAVVVVTVVALAGAGLLADMRAAHQDTGSNSWYSTPTLPFTVGPIPIPVRLSQWVWDSSGMRSLFAAEYLGAQRKLTIQQSGSDPATGMLAPTRFDLHGTLASLDLDGHGGPLVSWPATTPRQWLMVQSNAGPMTKATLVALAAAVADRPSTPPTELRIKQPRERLVLASWHHAASPSIADTRATTTELRDAGSVWLPPWVADEVTLCPPDALPEGPAGGPPDSCYTISLSVAPTSANVGEMDETGTSTIRQLDPTHRVLVRSGAGSVAVRRELALAVSVN